MPESCCLVRQIHSYGQLAVCGLPDGHRGPHRELPGGLVWSRYSNEYLLDEARKLLQEWTGKQDHDRCHYYPDVFRALCDLLDIDAPAAPTITLAEFQAGCRQFQVEEFGGVPGRACIHCGVVECFSCFKCGRSQTPKKFGDKPGT